MKNTDCHSHYRNNLTKYGIIERFQYFESTVKCITNEFFDEDFEINMKQESFEWWPEVESNHRHEDFQSLRNNIDPY